VSGVREKSLYTMVPFGSVAFTASVEKGRLSFSTVSIWVGTSEMDATPKYDGRSVPLRRRVSTHWPLVSEQRASQQ
jgi:hypothetical protein